MPPPTGVVSGHLMVTLYFLMAFRVSLGSHSPYSLKACSHAKISCQQMRFLPLYALLTAASNTRTDAFQISGPVPSPLINGMIGSLGTTKRFFSIFIAVPLFSIFFSFGNAITSSWVSLRFHLFKVFLCVLCAFAVN